jgi:sugar (pentulose or hexulose) kinase
MRVKTICLAVDLGASSGRVMAGAFDGKTIRLDEMNRFGNPGHAVHGNFHWDFLQLFADIKAGLRKAGQVHGKAVISAGIDTWGVDYGLIDSRGRLLGLPYQYRDPRTNGIEAKACKLLPREKIYGITGIQFMFLNTMIQLVAEKESKSVALANADRILFTPDLFNFWLTGVKANEYTIASTSQLLDARKRTWSQPLIKAMGLPAKIFGEIVEPGTVLGGVTSAIGEETGLPKMNIIAPGTHDTASAVAAVPARGTDHAYLSSGTWSLMGVETKQPVLNEKSYRLNFTNEGGVCGTIRLLKNICGLWLIQESQRAWERQGQKLSFAEIARAAEKAKPFAAVIDPDSPDFAAPGDMPERIRAFCKRTGQKPPATPGEIARTIYESLALKYRRIFGFLEELTGRRIGVLHIVGGGTQAALLNRFTADALNRPVIAGPTEATALGNILLQLIATKEIRSLDEGREIIRASFRTKTYEPENTAAWDAAFAKFLKVEGK